MVNDVCRFFLASFLFQIRHHRSLVQSSDYSWRACAFFISNQTTFLYSALMSGACIGLAILIKGPVALIISSGTFFILAGIDLVKTKHVSNFFTQIRWIVVMSCTSIIVASLWFGLEIAQHGTWFMEEFIRYQIRLFSTGDAGHSGPFYYHAIILLIGCFPASAFALKNYLIVLRLHLIYV